MDSGYYLQKIFFARELIGLRMVNTTAISISISENNFMIINRIQLNRYIDGSFVKMRIEDVKYDKEER